jgi:hypothetical protein
MHLKKAMNDMGEQMKNLKVNMEKSRVLMV